LTDPNLRVCVRERVFSLTDVVHRSSLLRSEVVVWVRIGSFPVKADEVGNLVNTYNQIAVPKVRSFPGNRGCLLLEPTVGEEPFVVMTIWEDRVAAEAYESSGAAAEVVALVRAFFAGPPTLRSYESSSLAGLPMPVAE
jgi:heme-degrading monooxygenase HmoA